MRLRYLAAGPLVAVAMFGTTAAAWPSGTAAMPQAPPALTASALSARYAADARAIGTAEQAAVRDGGPGRAAVSQLRVGGLRAGRAAPAGHRHRGVRQPRDGRLLGGLARHHCAGVGRPGERRLDQVRAAHPAVRAGIRGRPDVA